MIRAALVVAVFLALAAPAAAHHGGGTFDGSKELKLTGTFTGLDLVNPHSWIYFEVAGSGREGHQISLRDARGDGAAALGLEPGDVQEAASG